MNNDGIEIISSDYGCNVKILIDGAQINYVKSAEIHFTPSEVPVITLELIPKDLRIISDTGVIITNDK